MANNYCQFSFFMTCPSMDTRDAVVEWLEQLGEQRYEANEDPLYFCWAKDKYRDIWIYTEESGSPDDVVSTLRTAMDKLNFSVFVGFEWADTCSKPRIGEFGGGCAAFTKDTESWWNSSSQLDQFKQDLSNETATRTP